MEKRKQTLLKALQDKSEDIRSSAAEALEMLEVRGKISFLEKLVDSGEKIEKLRAIYALSNLRGNQVTNILIKATKDSVEDIRATAVRVLGKIADKDALPTLVERLKDASPIVERVTIEALGNYREPQILGPLMQMLKNPDAGVIERVIDVVSRTGDKRLEEAMLYFAVKGNPTMKCLAIKALGVMET